MHLVGATPAVWVYTTHPAYASLRNGGYGAFLTDAQKARLERIRQARMLFAGQHRQYYLDEGRTQFQFPETRAADGEARRLYVPFNVLRLISRKTADLLFGQDPLIRSADDIQQAHLADLASRSALYELLRRLAVECSYAGEAFIEASVRDGRVHLQRVPAAEIFADGPLTPDGQHERYTRFALRNAGTAERPIWLLLETTYTPGAIARDLWQLDDKGSRARKLDLREWSADVTLDPITPTRIPHNDYEFSGRYSRRENSVGLNGG